jgi:hypothetical protein
MYHWLGVLIAATLVFIGVFHTVKLIRKELRVHKETKAIRKSLEDMRRDGRFQP